MSNEVNLKCVDFFCGGGGMSLGLSWAKISVIGAIDNDPDCKATYEANHQNSVFIQADITEITPDVLAGKLKIEPDDDDLIFVGCSPCQYWSVITGRENSERKEKSFASRNLLRYFLQFVKHYRPGFVLIENVRGITRDEKESGLSELLTFFNENGYHYKSDILTAAHYGVPQTRRRYVLIASRTQENIKMPRKNGKIAVVRDAIGKEKEIRAGDAPSAEDPLHRSSALNDNNIARLKLTPEGGMRKHWAKSELVIPAYKNKPDSFFRENYGRMAWDSPAPTITTKFFAIGCGRFGHPEQHRAISLREGAILQTFPKKYKFKTKSFKATGKLIGNAVPPQLAFCIGKALVKTACGG